MHAFPLAAIAGAQSTTSSRNDSAALKMATGTLRIPGIVQVTAIFKFIDCSAI